MKNQLCVLSVFSTLLALNICLFSLAACDHEDDIQHVAQDVSHVIEDVEKVEEDLFHPGHPPAPDDNKITDEGLVPSEDLPPAYNEIMTEDNK